MRFLRFLTTTAFFLTSTSLASAGEFYAEAVAAADGEVKCLAHTSWIITTVSGPCKSFMPPEKVALGQTFVADGETQRIGVIVANQAEKDFLTHGMDIRKGQWTCVAAETKEDLPSDDERSRTWLYIRKCEPLRLLDPR
jgi:hypothetical protein